MRINLQGADATRLDIDLSENGEVRRVSLTGLHAVVGQLERGTSSARVRPLRVESVVLASLDWPLPAGGRLAVTSPASLAEVAIELDAAAAPDATPLSGRGSAARAEADAVTVDLPGGARIAFDADLLQASVTHSPERVGHAAAEKVEITNLQAALGGLLCRLSTALLEQVRVDWQAGELLIGAGSARAGGISVAIPGSGVTVDIERAELPGGVRTSAGAIVIPELVVPELRIAVDDVVELFRPRKPAAGTAAAESAPFDYSFLDRVSGRLDVDLTLDISVPVLGRREATHHFRVPISGGVINYRELERDLANIEDAFIDVEVRGRSLVIERAIPLIPGLEKPLIAWDLDPEELDLARRRLVRLRTIPRLRMVARGDRGGSDRSSLALRSVRFDDIVIAIAVAPPAEGERDAISRASAGELRVSGRLAHDANRTTEAAEATRVNLSGARLAAGPISIRLGGESGPGRRNGGGRIEAESIELGALADGSVSFAGLRPRGATLTGRDLRIRNLRVLFPR
jgi:hypothetical protein